MMVNQAIFSAGLYLLQITAQDGMLLSALMLMMITEKIRVPHIFLKIMGITTGFRIQNLLQMTENQKIISVGLSLFQEKEKIVMR